MSEKESANILWFDQIGNDDVQLVGGKNASLGEMYRALQEKGVRVPNGFAVTARAYRLCVEGSGLAGFIRDELSSLDTRDVASLQRKGTRIREAFLKRPLPQDLAEAIRRAYRDLSHAHGIKEADVAVRSSATAEDLPGASFAGQQETYLNIRGEAALLTAIRKAFASLYTDRAISYRADKGFDQTSIALSVGVQKMVRSDLGASGVMFTLDTESGFRDVVQISASWGLGEMVVQGKTTPDEFLVFKPTLAQGFPAIIKKELGEKAKKMVYDTRRPTREVKVTKKDQNRFALTDEEILTLARWGVLIEAHYSARAGVPRPMDMEWAKDGESGELFIVQARPETVQSRRNVSEVVLYTLEETGEVIAEGISVGTKIAVGTARVVLSTAKLSEFKDGEILVTEITDPDWEPIMKKASAIVTEKGGRTSHVAIVSRELGIPAVIGAPKALRLIKTGMPLTIDCSSGVTGRVYKGLLRFSKTAHDLGAIPSVNTRVCLNVGTPDGAFIHSFLPHQGVGLAREEFIIASQIGVHPRALINFDSLPASVKKRVAKRTAGYEAPTEFYVSKLAQGVAQIAAAFYPHQVIVRFSDFKTNEYKTLLGGEFYESQEENPMLGWRGASRYAHPDFAAAFALECEAVRRVRDQLGLLNVALMVPFCRTPEEGRRVLSIMESAGLKRGDKDLKVYVMCEIPTNVLRADEFLDMCDGFSIGSNDLAQLTLGLDRDSALVAGIANENDPSVRELVRQAIAACRRRGKYIGFCGQAPSDYPEFTEFLVREGIDAISLNPDSLIPMIIKIAEVEQHI